MSAPDVMHAPVLVLPDDEHNQTLVHNVHPSNWVNPEPTGPYNIVVVGAGTAGLGLKTIAGTIHPYPTQAEVVKKVANAWRKTTFTPRAKNILKQWFAWTR